MSTPTVTSMSDWLAPGSAAIDQAIRRASPGYESWWSRCASVGFCANPIQASAYDPDQGKRVAVMIRCGNRRAAICPSCSELYAADAWQLVHAGTTGGHHDIPTTVADRPQVFATLTAPSFGAVHTSNTGPTGWACHPPGSATVHCPHGKPLWCSTVHHSDDPEVGQPLCPECYDYTGHVLFNWHAPELWRRFTIALRRTLARHLRAAGADPDTVRVSFVKVAEYQRRAIIHYHTLIRLDPADDSQARTDKSGSAVSAAQLAMLVRQAAGEVRLPVNTHTTTANPDTSCQDRVLQFGAQIDTQPLTTAADSAEATPGLARRVAAYLAKYTTKSVAEFGIAARRISSQAMAELDIPAHTRRILSTLTRLATLPGNAAMLAWLHTLGYRGHITTKSRHYSTTMTALRAIRHHWRQHRPDAPQHVGHQKTPYEVHDRSSAASELISWRIQGAGHRDDGERLLVHTAAHQARQQRYVARLENRDETEASP
jgi:siroheme synthase (precorrin-2 oxidase/ferrochelatase)